MIIADIPVFTPDGGIKRLTKTRETIFGRLYLERARLRLNVEDKLLAVSFASSGAVLGQENMILCGKPLKDYSIGDKVKSTPNLRFGNKSLYQRIKSVIYNYKGYVPCHTEKRIAEQSVHLLSLDEENTRNAIIYMKRLFRRRESRYDGLVFEGAAKQEASKIVQIMGWKLGYQSTLLYRKRMTILLFQDEVPDTIIDYQRNQVIDTVVGINRLRSLGRTKLYFLEPEKGLEIIPSVYGMIGVN